MRIIKKGNKKEKPTKESCSKCGCVFEYLLKDIHADFRDGDYVKCPQCGSFIAAGYQIILTFLPIINHDNCIRLFFK